MRSAGGTSVTGYASLGVFLPNNFPRGSPAPWAFEGSAKQYGPTRSGAGPFGLMQTLLQGAHGYDATQHRTSTQTTFHANHGGSYDIQIQRNYDGS